MDKDTEYSCRDVVRIELSFNEAILRAARQNFDKDVRLGRANTVEWNDVQNEYFSEARAILLRDGENFPPEYPDYEHIILKTKSSR